MAASPPLTVVVVGAGLGGLLCANGLVHGIRDAPTAASDDATASPAAGPAPVSSDAVTDEPHVSATTGVRVIVLERDESAHSRAQGYYIGVQGDGLDAIGQVGLRDKVLENVKPGEGPFVFATASGSELCALHPSKQSGSKFEAHSMHRQRLRDALLEPVEDFVRFGARVTDVKQGDSDADPVTVVLDNGETIDADVVVGADGVNSTVARFMDLVDTRDDCQVRMLGGAVVDPDCTRMSTIHPSASTMMVVEQGPAMFIGTYTARSEDGVAAESTGDNVVNWGLGMPMEDKVPPSEWEETWIKEKVDAVALRDAAIANLTERGWKPEIVQLLKDTPADRLRCRDLFDRMPLSLSNGWKGRLTLLGDAAHPMTPYQGAGGNTAMADGASLSGMLGHLALTTPAGKVATGAAVTSALREYENEMFSRSTKYVNASRQACDAMHTTSAVKSTLRNTMMRGMGFVLRMMARR